jgi:hypothetical protein
MWFSIVGRAKCYPQCAAFFRTAEICLAEPKARGSTIRILRRLRSRMTHRAWRHTPTQAVFSGIILSPPGNYIIEARSVDDPQIFVHTAEPTTICKWNVRKPTRRVMILHQWFGVRASRKVTVDKNENNVSS